MNFTLVLNDGSILPFEFKADLSDESQREWTRALLWFVEHAELDWDRYEELAGRLT